MFLEAQHDIMLIFDKVAEKNLVPYSYNFFIIIKIITMLQTNLKKCNH